MPLLIASWCEPENAVKTKSPPYGWRSGTRSWLQYSTVERIAEISEKSIGGSTPWVIMFRPKVTRSTFPVRSPLPNRQPSMRSAPAMYPSSAAAIPSPRAFWGCSDKIMESRLAKLRCIHALEYAYTFGVIISTVEGRLMIIGSSGVASMMSTTELHTSTAKSSSVPVKDSGEYSQRQLVLG